MLDRIPGAPSQPVNVVKDLF
ncbi:unnamed protein product, partial [Allacma fusca]